MLNKEEIDKLLKVKGEVRGVVFQTDGKYVLEKEGEEGLKKLEKRAKELGLPVDYRKGKALDFHPIGLRVISLLLIKDTFGWRDQELWEMGYAAPKTSFMIKILMRFFINLKKFMEKIPLYWVQHYTIGKLEVVKFDEKDKKAIVRQTGLEIHPIFYTYLEGYYNRVIQFVEKNATVELKEATFEGEAYHVWTLRW